MICRRCHDATCPGCLAGRDCADCGCRFDADHLDDRGRCDECAAEVAADADVQPEVIRAAVAAAVESTRAQCAEVAERIARLYREAYLRSTVDREINAVREVVAERIAREIRALGNVRATSTLADTLPAPAR